MNQVWHTQDITTIRFADSRFENKEVKCIIHDKSNAAAQNKKTGLEIVNFLKDMSRQRLKRKSGDWPVKPSVHPYCFHGK